MGHDPTKTGTCTHSSKVIYKDQEHQLHGKKPRMSMDECNLVQNLDPCQREGANSTNQNEKNGKNNNDSPHISSISCTPDEYFGSGDPQRRTRSDPRMRMTRRVPAGEQGTPVLTPVLESMHTHL